MPALTPDALTALIQARHPDPFAVLGMHADEQGYLWVRTVQPGALGVEVLNEAGDKVLAALSSVQAEGVFEAKLPKTRAKLSSAGHKPAYLLRITWPSSSGTITQTLPDPYAFGLLLHETDLIAWREGRLLRPWTALGAHPMSLAPLHSTQAVAGVRFAVWAPHAQRVSVVGDFNGWDGRRHPMRRRVEAGVWEVFVPQAEVGQAYKFEIVSAQGQLLPLKADPFARAADLRPANASRVAPALTPPAPRWPAAARAQAPQAAISIYELHVGSWRRGDNGEFYDWDRLAAELPGYAASLGFTHVELMPIAEHPYDPSWGYQCLGLFAPTARFGDAAGFARFVQACHAADLGVILDWVPAHFPTDAHGLALFDGAPLFEYADPREGFHRDWNTAIYDFGRNEVRNFLCANALYWLEMFGVDGLRVDAVASMLYRDYSRNAGEWVPNIYGGRENLEVISLLRHINGTLRALVPNAIVVAEESTAFPGVTAPPEQGLGFHFKWNMGWMNDTLAYIHEDPVYRRWHHDKMRFGLTYAFSEKYALPISHDEVVHGKGSLLGKMPGDEWQRFANVRAYLGFMWGHPGKKLLFMGQEFAQTHEWRSDEALPWELLQQRAHKGVQHLLRDLNHLLRQEPALHQGDDSPQGFEWLVVDDDAQSVYVWLRRDAQGRPLMVVCNFTPVPRVGYRIGVPGPHEGGASAWVEVLNTDAGLYGGSDTGNASSPQAVQALPSHGRSASLVLTLPPLATLFLRPAA